MAKAGVQTGIKKPKVKKIQKGHHKKSGPTYESIMSDKSMSESEKKTIIKILGLKSKITKANEKVTPKPNTDPHKIKR